MISDDTSILISLKKILLSEGCIVECYEDTLILLKEYEPLKYKLLLIDLKLKTMSGFELAEIIRKIDKDIKICFISAFRGYYDSLVNEFPNLDFKFFIQKPIKRKELVYKIKQLLN